MTTVDRPPTRSTAEIVIATAAVDVGVAALAVGLTVEYRSLWPFAVALPAIGIVTFAGVYLDTRRIRNAIGASTFVVYLAMLGFALNSQMSRQVADNPFLKDLYSDFRTLVTTVVAFYFTADAAERIATRDTPGNGTGDSAPRTPS